MTVGSVNDTCRGEERRGDGRNAEETWSDPLFTEGFRDCRFLRQDFKGYVWDLKRTITIPKVKIVVKGDWDLFCDSDSLFEDVCLKFYSSDRSGSPPLSRPTLLWREGLWEDRTPRHPLPISTATGLLVGGPGPEVLQGPTPCQPPPPNVRPSP